MGERESEHTLWQAAEAGDADAFVAIYELHADRIFSFLLRRGASQSDAQDVVAETFLQLWRQRERIEFDESRGLLPWLFTVAGRVLRRNSIPSLVLTTPDAYEDVAGEVLVREGQRRIHVLLADLDPTDRELATALWVHGRTSSDVAEELGIAAGTVRWRASRLRRRLQEAWIQAGGAAGEFP